MANNPRSDAESRNLNLYERLRRLVEQYSNDSGEYRLSNTELSEMTGYGLTTITGFRKWLRLYYDADRDGYIAMKKETGVGHNTTRYIWVNGENPNKGKDTFVIKNEEQANRDYFEMFNDRRADSLLEGRKYYGSLNYQKAAEESERLGRAKVAYTDTPADRSLWASRGAFVGLRGNKAATLYRNILNEVSLSQSLQEEPGVVFDITNFASENRIQPQTVREALLELVKLGFLSFVENKAYLSGMRIDGEFNSGNRYFRAVKATLSDADKKHLEMDIRGLITDEAEELAREAELEKVKEEREAKKAEAARKAADEAKASTCKA